MDIKDYRQYREERGITAREMISVVRERYPRFSRPVQSMIDNREKYGVRLVPEAEELVERAFGPPPEHEVVRKKPCRKRPRLFTVRLTEDEAEAFRRAVRDAGFATVQEALRSMVLDWLLMPQEPAPGEITDEWSEFSDEMYDMP